MSALLVNALLVWPCVLIGRPDYYVDRIRVCRNLALSIANQHELEVHLRVRTK
jgi:hypothetical protein